MNINSIVASLNLTQDVTLLAFLALASFVYGMLLGKYRLLSVLVNIYVSFAIVSAVPENIISNYETRLVIFFVALILLTLMNKRFFDLSFSGAGSAFLWRVFVISFMEIGLILSIVFTIMPKKEALNFISITAYGYLVSGWAPLIWTVLPLAFMFMVYKRNRY